MIVTYKKIRGFQRLKLRCEYTSDSPRLERVSEEVFKWIDWISLHRSEDQGCYMRLVGRESDSKGFSIYGVGNISLHCEHVTVAGIPDSLGRKLDEVSRLRGCTIASAVVEGGEWRDRLSIDRGLLIQTPPSIGGFLISELSIPFSCSNSAFEHLVWYLSNWYEEYCDIKGLAHEPPLFDNRMISFSCRVDIADLHVAMGQWAQLWWIV